MSDERAKLEGYLRRLQELDREISDDSDTEELYDELNDIINGLTKESQQGIVKDTIKARLKFTNKSNWPDPSFEEDGSNGFDIYAHVPFPVQVQPGKIKSIPTGLHIKIEKGLELQLRSRRTLIANKGIVVLNSPDVIDSTFDGELQIIVANLGEFAQTIRSGDKIATGVVCPVYGNGNLEFKNVKS